MLFISLNEDREALSFIYVFLVTYVYGPTTQLLPTDALSNLEDSIIVQGINKEKKSQIKLDDSFKLSYFRKHSEPNNENRFEKNIMRKFAHVTKNDYLCTR